MRLIMHATMPCVCIFSYMGSRSGSHWEEASWSVTSAFCPRHEESQVAPEEPPLWVLTRDRRLPRGPPREDTAWWACSPAVSQPVHPPTRLLLLRGRSRHEKVLQPFPLQLPSQSGDLC